MSGPPRWGSPRSSASPRAKTRAATWPAPRIAARAAAARSASRSPRPRRPLRQSRAIVLDGADERLGVHQRGSHFDRAAVLAPQRPVLDRVLDQRLQKEPWQKRSTRPGAHLPAEGEMTGVPLLEDLRVVPQPIDLLAQRLHLAFVAERMSQEIAERSEEAPRCARVLG